VTVDRCFFEQVLVIADSLVYTDLVCAPKVRRIIRFSDDLQEMLLSRAIVSQAYASAVTFVIGLGSGSSLILSRPSRAMQLLLLLSLAKARFPSCSLYVASRTTVS
jgi:hypothetical protein